MMNEPRVVLDCLTRDPGNLEVEHGGPNVIGMCRFPPGGSLVRGICASEPRYLEYSSTMSCSWTGAATSRRSGLRRTFAVNES